MKTYRNENIITEYRDILTVLQRYCAYQDRCRQDIARKMDDLGFSSEYLDQAISDLTEEGFLNEERFARMFVRGHFRKNKWGRLKIKQALQQKGIPGKTIQDALEEIEGNYDKTLLIVLEKKLAKIPMGTDKAMIWKKLQVLGLQKGYEHSTVYACIRKLLGS